MISFFSTVAYRLEKGNWGKRFPPNYEGAL